MDALSSLSGDKVVLDDDDDSEVEVEDSEVEVEESPKLVFKANHEVKLKELLHNLNTLEIKICSHAAKEFIKLLKGDSGGELLRLYVHTSNNFSELMEAWKLRQGKPGMSYIFSLICAILSHSDGLYRPNDKERVGTSRAIDKFARMIIDEKIGDVYKELNSKEGKRQSAALLLMASVVRRGSGLATDVAKNFDFKLPVFSKLSEYKQKRGDKKRKHSTRKSFVRFAMSFLEVGKPGLLRWVLQQREMFSGVLRGLGNDEDEVVIYVLSTLQTRVLTEESLVPPGLRSVLFGSVTLEQLVGICGRENGGAAAELAYHVLVMVCTEPCNGLMPDLKRRPNPLRGNPKRLLGLMKKLKATEINYHRDLLLAILQGKPSLGSEYMDQFPYNLEDYASPTWFANVSLAANLVSKVGMGFSFDFLDAQSHDPPSFNSADVQSVLNCTCPRPFSRSVINKGLLHSDYLVKHGTLRLLLEALKLLDSFISVLRQSSCTSNQMMQSWTFLIQEVQNAVRTLLPDPQVLLTLFSLQSSHNRYRESHSKRKSESSYLLECSKKGVKKMKTDVIDENTDIIVGGIISDPQIDPSNDGDRIVDTLMSDKWDHEKDFTNVISEIWGLDQCSGPVALNDADIIFLSKLLDALKIYIRMMPSVLEGSFDFFANLLSDPLAVTTSLQSSLLSLLVEYIEFSPRSGIPIKAPPLMYKHLQSFINLSIFSPISEVKDHAFNLAQAAMFSTGAFDTNINEISAWFLFLPGYSRNKCLAEDKGLAVLQSLSRVVISFLCDAISTVGNSLFKYWAIIEKYTNQLKNFKGVSVDFSPLIMCVLQKCLRILNSESGTFSLPEKSMISLYVSNTLKYLLQTQVDVVFLSALIESNLSEGLVDRCSVDDDSGDGLCEWRPLKNLLLFSQSLSQQQTRCMFSFDRKVMPSDNSFLNILGEVKKIVSTGHTVEVTGIVKAFSSAMLCTTPDGLLKNFPSVIAISQNLHGVPFSLLSSIIFLDSSFLASVSKMWPEIFFPGLEKAITGIHHEVGKFDTCGITSHSLLAEVMQCDIDFEATESAAVAFSFFLKHAPFHVLFPAIMRIDVPNLLDPFKIKDLLLAKVSEWTSDCLIFYLRLLLFWLHQIQLSYKIEPIAKLQKLSEICLIFVKHVFAQLSGYSRNARFHISAEKVQEMAEIVFRHPAVLASLTFPLSCNEELTKGNSEQYLETLLIYSQQNVHKIDQHVLDVLTTTSDFLLSSFTGQDSVLNDEVHVNKPLIKAFNTLVERLFLELRNKFEFCIATKDVIALLSKFYALHALIRFISPFELLELVHWMFSRVNMKELSLCKSGDVSVLSVGFCIAGGAFEALADYLRQPTMKRVFCDLLWDTEERTFDVNCVEEIYVEVCKFATNFDLDIADTCLLKMVEAIYNQNYLQQNILHRLNLVISRIIMRTPIKMISHCVYRANMTKAKLLLLFTKMSSLHLLVFGNLLLGIMNKGSLVSSNLVGTHDYALADEDFIMLLPATLSYVDSNFVKFEKQYHSHFKSISSYYSRILFNGFRNWKSFVSGFLFQEEYGNFFPSSAEELLNFVGDSLLGKTIHMLRYHFALSRDSLKTKKLMKLFNSIFPSSGAHNELLDCDVNELKFNSVNETLNLINRVVAKISLSRMLLFPEDHQVPSVQMEVDEGSKEFSVKPGSNEKDPSRMRFMNILVGTWQKIVKKLPSDGSRKNKGTDCLLLYKYLEVFILRSILDLTTMMLDGLIEMQSIPFLEQLMKSSLFYRFEDPTTLKILHSIISSLLEGKFSRVPYLQLLLAHSQFAPAIQSACMPSMAVTGVFLRPMSSILRLLVISHSNPNAINEKNDLERTELLVNQLEVVKLLRTLLQSKTHLCSSDFGKDSGINLRELHSLLLSSYGATLRDIDLEMFNVMHEIKLIDESDNEIAQLDYLWGGAALKVRKERALEQDTSWNVMTDTEAVKERRRSQFRENLPIDPKICAMTVLYFPYDRIAGDELSSSNKSQVDNLTNVHEMHPPGLESIQRYDPVFILSFSIHSLSVGFIEPVEFAGLGLLAVAFASMSSPDVGMRKLGYETLGRFKNALEKCQKKKDVMRLRLLLTYIQNGIEEPWQRIPSVIAIFAAEASLLLLDPSNEHYATLSKLLMRSSRVNIKCIPFFHDFFLSSSINFKAERLWMLRLVYAGLNFDDDAHVYIRNSIIEVLLSFYVSPLSDNELKELILLIVRKSVRLHKLACYLVEHCGLISWLSALLSNITGMLLGDVKGIFLAQLVVITEVVNSVISSRNITEWLQTHALEQLVELSSLLFKLFVAGMKLIGENVSLVKSILQILISTLKISQKRKIYQPHLTLSLESFFQIYQTINVHDNARSSVNAELGLKAILMSTPPVDIFQMDTAKLSSFLMWAISTAVKSESGQMHHLGKVHQHFASMLEEVSFEESLTSTFLRWLVASVILSKLSLKNDDFNSKVLKGSHKTLHSLLDTIEKGHGGVNKKILELDEMLAAAIFYLQQLLGVHCTVLSSVVSALCLLLYGDLQCAGSHFKLLHHPSMASLCSRICCPAEANPSWRWSFYQPWKDLSSEMTDSEKMDEVHACQSLLEIISKVLGKKSLDSEVCSYQEPEISGVFEWEKSIIETQQSL